MAGKMERKCLEALGVIMRYKNIDIGQPNPNWMGGPKDWNGIGYDGYLKNYVLRDLISSVLSYTGPAVKSYADLWGSAGFVVSHAQNCQISQVQNAILCLQEVVKHRTADMIRCSKRLNLQVPPCFQANGGQFCRYGLVFLSSGILRTCL